MACRSAMRSAAEKGNESCSAEQIFKAVAVSNEMPDEKVFLFGVDSCVPANEMLQNNLTQYEWATRNKLEPNFWGRNITGENSLTQKEIEFLHRKGCKIVPTFVASGDKETEEQGKLQAKKIVITAMEFGIPERIAIFIELGEENATRDYMLGFAKGLLAERYIPGFKVSTDSQHEFNHEFSRGIQSDKDVFDKCLIWAVTPSLSDYNRITTAHLLHPDKWAPYAPSGIRRKNIAIWQYGKNCHPIDNDDGKEVVFNINLIQNINILFNHMF